MEESTPSHAAMIVIHKDTRAVRIWVDPKPFNKSFLQEVHPMSKMDITLAQLSSVTIFIKLDVNSGF